ncbi:MAG TPA: hypothetical protein VL134_03995 [Leptolyngbya sp.]|nr:hypothetical protein [Leptolyngbya sp.]
MDYFSAAVGRVFSLSDDAYPNTGIQPFSGSVYDKKHDRKHFER